MVIIFNLIRIVGILLFLYVFWKNLKDDYPSEDVVWLGWLIVAVFYLGSRVLFSILNPESFGLFSGEFFLFWSIPGLNYFGGYLFVLILLLFYAKKKSWKLILLLEDGVKPFLLFLIFNYLDELIRTRWLWEIVLKVLFLIIVYNISGILKLKYRSFVWFKSGKKGFVFWFASALIFGLFAINNIIFRNGIMMTSVYGLSCLISVTGLFILGDVWKKN